MPFIFSFITLRYERFGAIIHNPYLDSELMLDPVEAYIAGLCDGSRSARQVELAARRHFSMAAGESKERVYRTLKKLLNIYSLGFCETAKKPGTRAHGRGKFTEKGPYLSAPRIVTWEVTSACNLRCPHCYNVSGTARDGELNTQEAFSLIDRLADAKVLRLLISGGEPFLRPDIVPILRRASGTNMRLDIATNGVHIPRKALHEMHDLPVFHVHVSIDGIGDQHDRFRGRKAAFDAACKNIRRLQDEGIAVSLSTTVTRENLSDLEKIIALAIELDCSGFFANAMLPAGRGRESAGRFRLDAAGYRHMYKTLVEKGKELKGRLAISTDMCFPFLFSSPPAENVPEGSMGCAAGQDTLCIGADGTAYPCHLLRDFPLGNVMESGLSPIWESSGTLQQLRTLSKKDMTGSCSTCRFAPGLCHGGCRAAAYLEYGDLRAVDPTCFRTLADGSPTYKEGMISRRS
jgi:radical SAM protein with 4Fe4S-binding SPASM domain